MGRTKQTKRARTSVKDTAPRKRASGVKSAKKYLPKRATARLNETTAGFLGIEKKFYDTNLNSAALSDAVGLTAGMIDPSATSMISTPTQGDGEQQREGKRIVIKSVQVNGIVYNSVNEGTANPPVRCTAFVALVLDTQSNGAQCTSDQVFKNTSADLTGIPCPLRNLLYATRFKVLKTGVFDLNPVTLASHTADHMSWATVQRTFNWYLPLDLVVNFNNGTTASIANVVDNSLHMIAFVDDDFNAPRITYNARIRFVG